MEFKFDDGGLKDLINIVNDFDKRQNENGGSIKVSFSELFNDNFMLKYTSFKTLNELFEKSGFKLENEEDFKNIPDTEWDIFIKNNTKFSSWKEMYSEAGKEYLKSQLGF